MSVLVIAEHSHSKLAASTLNTLTAAAQLGQPIQVLVAGINLESIIKTVQSIAGVTEILVADHRNYEHFLAESWAPLIAHLAQQSVSHVLAPATTFGKNILPRAAALLKVAQISDIMAIVDHNTYQRPIYAGNAIATVRSQDPVQMITVRPTAFAPAVVGAVQPNIKVTAVTKVVEQQQSRFVREEQQPAERPDLSSANIVIAGGRGLGDKATFARLTAIADRLHAAVGASRAAVDAGLAPNDWQVGQTGKVIAPQLYIAIGISGAIQHLAGMKDSKVIVAINKDPDAPIFQIADLGLVADIPAILSEWEAALDAGSYNLRKSL